jgi:HK97 family phage major capsid protein
MPAVIVANPYKEKCDRFNALRAELKTVQDAAEQAGAYSPENKARFDKLAAEATALKKEILGADAVTQGQQLLREFDEAADSPAPRQLQPEQVEQQLKADRKNYLRGTYKPRNFKLGSREENHRAAYDSGLVMLARTGSGAIQEWSRLRCAERGIDLLQISPFMGEDGQATGGYLVFPEFEATLIDLKEEYGVIGRNAMRIPMTSDTKLVPRRAGGTAVYYPGENGQIPASAMNFDQVQLIAKKYAQLSLWSTELNEDAVVNFADILAAEMAYQFAKAEDFNAAQGDGTSTYAGVVGFLQALVSGKNGISPTASVFTPASGNGTTTVAALAAATTANGGGFVTWNKVLGALPVYAEGRAKWFMHKTVFWTGIAPLIEAAGGNIAMYLSTGIPLKFLGYDVEFMQAMPNQSAISGASATPALQAVAVLGDMGITCFMGTRRGVTVKTSDQRFIEFDQLAIQCTERVAINNVCGDSVAPTVAAGPMVALTLPAT